MSVRTQSTVLLRREVRERLRQRRISLNLSQEDLAWAADITQGSISNYETGRNEIPLSVLIAICSALQTRPVELIPMLAEIPSEPQPAVVTG